MGSEPKRAQIPVRTTPEVRARLQAAAADAGRSVTQEVEARLEASLALDRPALTAETMRLLAALAADIERAETLTGRKWHKHLPTWAMVREALASGEIERRCPENDRFLTDEDGESARQREQRHALFMRILHDARTVRELGFNLVWQERSAQEFDKPLFNYADEATRLEKSPLPDAVKAIIKDVYLSRMAETDERRGKEERAYWEGFRWMADAINEGVIMWENDLRQRGIVQAREYRPSATFHAPRPTLPAASTWWPAQTLGDLMQSGGALEPPKGDDNPA